MNNDSSDNVVIVRDVIEFLENEGQHHFAFALSTLSEALSQVVSERDALRAALLPLVDACEADFGIYDDDDGPVAAGNEGPSALTFPMIRAGRAALKGNTP